MKIYDIEKEWKYASFPSIECDLAVLVASRARNGFKVAEKHMDKLLAVAKSAKQLMEVEQWEPAGFELGEATEKLEFSLKELEKDDEA